ncbi:hypothetical protein [Riemerella anatipestifer]|uniref:hypothetical protein n=1 Tax=Riemerella anatipestifer TaxID=34085 RepID=UPI00129EFA1A|nr:hypothetical protein [Riemerella anatipestifer]MDY3520582.1 hypothetical protein [Riemerella anatipestifer]MDY3532365.1 hypothetical protein [Riemerella anatipestifer]MDY3535080.1 hypothetical protein [Riemerella anatipestifer]MRM82648.1 hypothetical protein [Riemerella anatipestifer]
MTKGLLILLLSFLMISCQKDRVEGVYTYVDNKEDNSFYRIGIRLKCAMIGSVEFKGGKCYVNIEGVQKRMDYNVEGDKIYIKVDDAEEIIEIIDDKTISVAGGCIFKKD